LKPEWWGSPRVQEKYQREKACDKRQHNNNNNNNNNNLSENLDGRGALTESRIENNITRRS
jgi:hypothetical protein